MKFGAQNVMRGQQLWTEEEEQGWDRRGRQTVLQGRQMWELWRLGCLSVMPHARQKLPWASLYSLILLCLDCGLPWTRMWPGVGQSQRELSSCPAPDHSHSAAGLQVFPGRGASGGGWALDIFMPLTYINMNISIKVMSTMVFEKLTFYYFHWGIQKGCVFFLEKW